MYMVEHGTNAVFGGFLGNKLFFLKKDMTYDCSEYFKSKFPGKSLDEIFVSHRDNLYKLVLNLIKKII